MVDHEGTLQIKYDGSSMKTNIMLTRFGGTFGTLRFNEKTFFKTILGFTPYWDYKPNAAIHANSPGVTISHKHLSFSPVAKIHLKCDCINGYNINGVQQPLLYSFVSSKPPVFKVFCEPETIHYKKIKQICFENYINLIRR